MFLGKDDEKDHERVPSCVDASVSLTIACQKNIFWQAIKVRTILFKITICFSDNVFSLLKTLSEKLQEAGIFSERGINDAILADIVSQSSSPHLKPHME